MAYRYYDFKNLQSTKFEQFAIRPKPGPEGKMVKKPRKYPRKFSQTPSILSRSDQELIGGKFPLKTPVYVHEFKAAPTPRPEHMITRSSVYTHGYQDIATTRSKILKSKFDSLTLTNRSDQKSHSSKYSTLTIGTRQASSVYSRTKPRRSITAEPINEHIISKLEESYWANWKPNQAGNNAKHIKKSIDKIYQLSSDLRSLNDESGSYQNLMESSGYYAQDSCASMENEGPTGTGTGSVADETEIANHENMSASVRSDEKAETVAEVDVSAEKPLEYLHEPSGNPPTSISDNELNSFLNQKASDSDSLGDKLKSLQLTVNDLEEMPTAGSSHSKIVKDFRELEKELCVTPHLTSSSSQNSEEQDVRTLKHTDSFIITVKKQNVEKARYPQPKCIKLQKNPTANRAHNYIKGGSYPLKSCLKKDKLSSQSLVFGKPGSPMLLQPSKAKKARKYNK